MTRADTAERDRQAKILEEIRAERVAQGLPERLEDPEGISAVTSVLLATEWARALLLGGGDGR